MISDNIFWSIGQVTQAHRWARSGHKGCIVWFTGLSGSGKSTISRAVERQLFERGLHPFVLDGDNLRHGLNSNLGFSPEDRTENIRRAAEVGGLLASAGHVTLIALIAPSRRDRMLARSLALQSGCQFMEVFVDAPLAVCEERDPKNLYRRARAGEIRGFTGIDAPYEVPENPDVHLPTGELGIDECVALVTEKLLPLLRLDDTPPSGS